MKTIQIYRSGKQWAWRLVGPNGRKLATPGERFTQKSGCLNNIRLVLGATVYREDDSAGRYAAELFKVEWKEGK